MRELRKDAAFLHGVREQEKAAAQAERRSHLRAGMSFMQQQVCQHAACQGVVAGPAFRVSDEEVQSADNALTCSVQPPAGWHELHAAAGVPVLLHRLNVVQGLLDMLNAFQGHLLPKVCFTG